MKGGKSFNADSKGFLDTSELIPDYRHHVARNVVTVGDSKLLSVISFQGSPFMTVLNDALEKKSDNLTRFFNELVKINAPNIEFKSHIVKRKAKVDLNMSFSNWFTEQFAKKYMSQFEEGDFYYVKYYLSITLKYNRGINRGIEDMQDALNFCTQALQDYQPKVLGVRIKEGEIVQSEIGRFLASLVNCNEDEDNYVTLSSDTLSERLQNAKIYFGSDLAEIRLPQGGKKYGVFYDLMEYPSESFRGMWNKLLDEKTEFVLTQSFFPFTMSGSAAAFDTQINKLNSSSRPPQHYIDELEAAKSLVSTGELIIGDYHATLTVFGDTAQGALDNGGKVYSTLITSSYANFLKSTNTGFKSFYSHLPDSQYKPFSEPKSTRNFVNGWSLNNYPVGKAVGNPIGDGYALMPLKTVADSIYYFNSHYSEIGKNNLGEKMLGHCMILGQSGAGKTTLEGVLANFIGRFEGKFFAIDFNKSMKLFFETLGGQYFDIESGVETGLNPFQLPDSADTRDFLYKLLATCGQKNNGEPVTAVEESKIKSAVDTIMMMPEAQRRFSYIASLIPPEGDDGLGDRLSKWQYSCGGTYAWALDCEKNLFNPDKFNRIAFNSTDILDGGGSVVTEPILSVLFQIKDMMQKDGQLMTSFIEEFWVPANFPTTQEKIKGTLKAGRIKNEFMFLVSQSPSDAINCQIFDSIVEQTATKIYLPNTKAVWEQYEKCGLNRKEFDELVKLDLLSRTFLISQDSGSGFCKLDLYGYDQFLPVISSTWEGISIADKVRDEMGPVADSEWVPEFIYRVLSEEKRKRFSKESFDFSLAKKGV